MTKIIKLNESDLQRIVKRVLTEQVNVSIPAQYSYNRDTHTSTIQHANVDVTPALVGAFIGGGIALITKLIRDKKQKQLKSLLGDVNIALKNKLTPAEYDCISEKLSKMGKITKLNDSKKTNETILTLNSCLGDMSRVEEVKTFLDGYIQKIEDEKKYLKDIKKIK